DAFRQLAVDADQHVLRLLLDQRLGRENVLDLGGADAVCQRAKRAVCRGVRVTADDGHAGEGETLLRADDVNDALTDVVLGVILDAEVTGVLRERLDLNAAFLVLDTVLAVRRGRNVVVNDRKRLLRLAHLTAGQAEAFKGLRARHLMDEVAVDVEQAGAVALTIDNVIRSGE